VWSPADKPYLLPWFFIRPDNAKQYFLATDASAFHPFYPSNVGTDSLPTSSPESPSPNRVWSTTLSCGTWDIHSTMGHSLPPNRRWSCSTREETHTFSWEMKATDFFSTSGTLWSCEISLMAQGSDDSLSSAGIMCPGGGQLWMELCCGRGGRTVQRWMTSTFVRTNWVIVQSWRETVTYKINIVKRRTLCTQKHSAETVWRMHDGRSEFRSTAFSKSIP
jgi:hypothetical protein